MKIKETLLPFLLGVVVTVAVTAMVSPCCKDVLAQQQKEIADTKKIAQGLKKDVVNYKKAVDKLFKELHPEPAKSAEAAKTAAKNTQPVKK